MAARESAAERAEREAVEAAAASEAATAVPEEGPAPDPAQHIEPQDHQDGKLILTGLNLAMVNTTRPHPMGPSVGTHLVVEVREGQALPTDLAEGEEDRLRELGAFGDHPREVYARKIDALVAAGQAKRGGMPDGGSGSGQADDGEGPGPEDDDEDVNDDDFDADSDFDS